MIHCLRRGTKSRNEKKEQNGTKGPKRGTKEPAPLSHPRLTPSMVWSGLRHAERYAIPKGAEGTKPAVKAGTKKVGGPIEVITIDDD